MNPYFEEPRLRFGAFQSFLLKLVTYCSYAGLVVSFIFLLLSDYPPFRWFSILLGFFLFDRLLHAGEAEISIKEALRSKSGVNLARLLTPAAYGVLERSLRKALLTRHNFYALLVQETLKRSDSREIISRVGVRSEEVVSMFKQMLEGEQAIYDRNELLARLDELVVTGYAIAVDAGERFIEPRDLFAAAMLSEDGLIGKLCVTLAITPNDIKEGVALARYGASILGMRRLPLTLGGFAHHPHFLRHRTMNRAWTARPTPVLDSFGIDLTDLARDERVGFLVGHNQEFEKLIDVISRPGKPNALLVGEVGSGKTTIVHHLAFKIMKDEVPEFLFDKRVVAIEIGRLLSGAEPEAVGGRLQEFAEEILIAGNVIVFIPDIHNLFKTTSRGMSRAIDIFLPIVRDASIPVIGATYPKEFKKYIESNSDFLEQFEIVRVEEITEEEAVRFLLYSSLILEREFGARVTIGAVRRVVEVARRHIRVKPLPASAADLLKEAFVKASRAKLKVLDEAFLDRVAEEKLKIPIGAAGRDEVERLLNLEKIIHQRLVNQDEAVKAVASALREYRSGLSRKGGPIAVFLFVGPTGVGKTELAKILAEAQFGSREAILRFDMSEYQDRQSLFRLIGTPLGAATGDLTDAVREHPYSLVLLDEFEKAHPDILNLFLQVFDDGRLTDSLGRVADFKNTLIVATSNAHSDFIKEEIEKGRRASEIGEELTRRLTQYFKPELINRFSDIIVFRDLDKGEILKVAELLLGELKELVKASQGIKLLFEAKAVEELMELGYSKVFGARPLRKVIANKIKSELAELILRKEIVRGDTVKVSFAAGDFVFNKGDRIK